MHAAAFALALPALGTTFIGAALATHATRLTPRWQLLLGVAGGNLLLAAGAANLAIADGSKLLLFVGVPGYFAWMAWLLATGVRLVRARTADRPDVGGETAIQAGAHAPRSNGAGDARRRASSHQPQDPMASPSREPHKHRAPAPIPPASPCKLSAADHRPVRFG